MKAASTCIIDEAPDDYPSHLSAACTNKPTCVSAPVSKTEPYLLGSTDITGQPHAEKHQAAEAVTAAAAVCTAQCSQGAGADARRDPVCKQGPVAADTGECNDARSASSSEAGSDTDDSWQDARLPDHVVVALLEREHLVISGHLHMLTNVKLGEEKGRKHLLTKQRQARMQMR